MTLVIISAGRKVRLEALPLVRSKRAQAGTGDTGETPRRDSARRTLSARLNDNHQTISRTDGYVCGVVLT